MGKIWFHMLVTMLLFSSALHGQNEPVSVNTCFCESDYSKINEVRPNTQLHFDIISFPFISKIRPYYFKFRLNLNAPNIHRSIIYCDTNVISGSTDNKDTSIPDKRIDLKIKLQLTLPSFSAMVKKIQVVLPSR